MSTAPIRTAGRIHPLMAGAAISVTIISLVGAAAIAGLLPSSHSENKAADASLANAPITTPAQAAAALAPATPQAVAAAEPAPAPVAQKPRVRHVSHTQVAQAPREQDERSYRQADERSYHQAPQPAPQAAPAPAQPNYVGIGAGAVIGGLLGNQVGGGRGKTLATIAGVIGGGMLGNEAQKQIQQQQPEPQR